MSYEDKLRLRQRMAREANTKHYSGMESLRDIQTVRGVGTGLIDNMNARDGKQGSALDVLSVDG